MSKQTAIEQLTGPDPQKNAEEDFLLRLRPLPGWRYRPEQRLRAALKRLLRDYGLRAVECKPGRTPHVQPVANLKP